MIKRIKFWFEEVFPKDGICFWCEDPHIHGRLRYTLDAFRHRVRGDYRRYK